MNNESKPEDDEQFRSPFNKIVVVCLVVFIVICIGTGVFVYFNRPWVYAGIALIELSFILFLIAVGIAALHDRRATNAVRCRRALSLPEAKQMDDERKPENVEQFRSPLAKFIEVCEAVLIAICTVAGIFVHFYRPWIYAGIALVELSCIVLGIAVLLRWLSR